MDCSKTIICAKRSLFHRILMFAILVSSFGFVLMLQSDVEPSYLANPPHSELFEPIEISPAVIPKLPKPGPLPPTLPSFPSTYEPVLTGRCPVNFSAISNIMDKTASNCFESFAAALGDVVCCPQFVSLLHIFLGHYSIKSDKLVLESAMANDCLKDITNILASRRANNTICTICSIKSSNLTGGSCPVKDVVTFEKTVSTSKLLEACGTVDPLKECCRPVCQPAVMEAIFEISRGKFTVHDNKDKIGAPNNIDTFNDCKGVVYSWLSRKLSLDAANTAFRLLSACKVNKVCPLNFVQPTEVIKGCRNNASSRLTCCSSLSNYTARMQEQMLITNKQAIVCATTFGSMLQKGGIMTDLYELCGIGLKDFSVQAYGNQGCLLRSLPVDMIFDEAAGLAFTCDLSDNIVAPWPSSSSITSLSFCAPETSLPELPTPETLKSHGLCYRRGGLEFLAFILSFIISSMISY